MERMSLIERKIGEIFQTLKLAKKTSRDDYFQHLRLVALGLGAVGGIAFIIKLVSEFISIGLGGRG
jgi:protein transport protein SEC61 subunit gamma-like protein